MGLLFGLVQSQKGVAHAFFFGMFKTGRGTDVWLDIVYLSR